LSQVLHELEEFCNQVLTARENLRDGHPGDAFVAEFFCVEEYDDVQRFGRVATHGLNEFLGLEDIRECEIFT
jgi:hypothetical protein